MARCGGSARLRLRVCGVIIIAIVIYYFYSSQTAIPLQHPAWWEPNPQGFSCCWGVCTPFCFGALGVSWLTPPFLSQAPQKCKEM